MMHRIFRALLLYAALAAAGAIAPAAAQLSKRDEKAYREASAAFRDSIWSMNLPQFKDYTVPALYRNSSRVMLADYTGISAGVREAAGRGNTNFTQITRRLVRLNDAAAVKFFSQLSYTQLHKEQDFYRDDQYAEFIGVRVIKASGGVTEISGDDIVLTKDEREERQAMLAVPDLQPGDMLDYYVAIKSDVDFFSFRSLSINFPFYSAGAPVLHTSFHCEIGKSFAAEYRAINGGPEFISTKDEAGTNYLDVSVGNLLLIPPGTEWTSPMRQFPSILLNIVRGDNVPYTPLTRRRPGEIYKDQAAAVIIRDEMLSLNRQKAYITGLCNYAVGQKSTSVAIYYEALLAGGKRLQEDSAAAEFYYMFRYDAMFARLGNVGAADIKNMGSRPIDASRYAYLLSEYFKRHNLVSEVVLAAARNGPRMDEVMFSGDIRYLCNIRGKHDILFRPSFYYSPAFYIPADVEGEDSAVAVNTKGVNSKLAGDYTQRTVTIPRSTAADNVHAETLTVMPDPKNDGVYVARVTSLTGSFKDSVQPKLLLLEDFYDYERSFFNDERTLVERLRQGDPSATNAEELKAAFELARKSQKDSFLTETKAWLNQEVTDQSNISIVNPGVRHTAPAFEYASAFRLQGVLKQAGDNYVLEAGRLIGARERVADALRVRTADIYLPFAHTIRIDINIRIPEGYTIEGLAELGKVQSNSAGSFKASAVLDGNIVSIRVEEVLSAAQYAARDWPQLLALSDAAADWTGAKLLLRKKT